jgi:hypothetical protein
MEKREEEKPRAKRKEVREYWPEKVLVADVALDLFRALS